MKIQKKKIIGGGGCRVGLGGVGLGGQGGCEQRSKVFKKKNLTGGGGGGGGGGSV